MSSLSEWWKGLFSKDRRKTDRVQEPKLAVYYWTDSKPTKHEVRDISPTGIYVVTDERWYPGTIIKMTIQRTDGVEETVERHIAVESKAVRWGEDGVGLSFIMPDDGKVAEDKGSVLELTSRKKLEQFLKRLKKQAD